MNLYGFNVVIEELQPRYVLPDDVPPPKGMTREEFNEWARRVCGFHSPRLKDGEVLFFKEKKTLRMTADTRDKLKETVDKFSRI